MIRPDTDSRPMFPADIQKCSELLPQTLQLLRIFLIGISQCFESCPLIHEITRVNPDLFHVTGCRDGCLGIEMDIRGQGYRVSPPPQFSVYVF